MRFSLLVSFFVALFLAASLDVATAAAAPKLTGSEKAIYNTWSQEYRLLYEVWRYDAQSGIPFYSHLVVSHPDLEQRALEYALQDGYGPYAVEHKRSVSYAMTLIPGNRGPAIRWNLRQGQLGQYDASIFWKIDRRGAKLLRFDIWPAGAQAAQLERMQDVINRFRAAH